MLSASTTSAQSRKRKIVCSACRLRKKRCDGLQPSCSSCRKWGQHCEYTAASNARLHPEAQLGAIQATGFSYLPPGPDHHFYTNASLQHQNPAPSQPHALNPGAYTSSNCSSTNFDPSLDLSDYSFLLPTPSRLDHDSTSAYNVSAGDFPELLPHISSSLESGIPAHPTNSQVTTDAVHESNNFPHPDHLLELAELFLGRFSVFLPFFHRASFLEGIRSQELLRTAPALVYAVMSISAVSHSDSTVRAEKENWYTKAQNLYAETPHDPQQPLRVIQAAACIVFQALMSRDYSVAWLVMGKAWRQAVAVGFHRLEGDSIRSPGQAPEPASKREKDEQRRTMWTLFILDRGMCFPIGLPHAIDDRQFMANLPLNDDDFQGTSSVPIESATTKPFTRNFTKLVASIQADPDDPSPNLFHFIIVSYILLGRIIEHIQAPYASTDPDEYESEFQALDADLIRLRLSIPRSASLLPIATAGNFKNVVWLNAVINISIIILHARPASKHTTRSGQGTSNNSTPGDVSRSSGLAEQKLHWSQCLTTARNTVALVKDASRVSMEILFNPHISVAFYLAGRIIAVEYLDTQSASVADSEEPVNKYKKAQHDSLRAEIDLLLLLFDRLTEAFRDLGTKFKTGLLFNLEEDVETSRRIKTEGIKALFGNCPGWSSQAQDYRQVV